MDNRTEQLADGVWRVEVGFYINTFVLANDGHGDGDGLTLIDTGRRRDGPRLVRSVRMLGLDPRGIGAVLLTHCHPDHAGSAARFATSSASSQVWVGERDLATVHGKAPQPPMPLPVRLLARIMGDVRPVPEARPLVDGTELAPAGGVRTVAAPGHTPGHCAFLLPERGVLLAGDAVWNVWFLSRGPRFLCSETPAVPATLRRLAALEFDTLAMAHGPPVTTRARDRLACLVP
ncbi:MAG: MBL fold metallo-hydrolase [Egibacteraceae bacterium]